MTDEAKQFAPDLGLPKIDVDKLVATQQKNFEALTQTARITTEGVKGVAAKQREIIESAFREAVGMARSVKLTGDPKEILGKQMEAVNRALDSAVGNTREAAERIQKANAEAFKVVADRITESIAEIRQSFRSGASASGPKP